MNISFIQKIIGFSVLSVGSVLTIVLPIVLKQNNKETKIDNIDIENTEVQGASDDYIYLYAYVKEVKNEFKSWQIDQTNKNFKCLFQSVSRTKPFYCEISKLKDNENKIHKLGNIESLKNYQVVASDLSAVGKIFQIKIKTSDWKWTDIYDNNDEYIDIISTTDQTKKYLQFHQIFATYQNQKKLIFNHIIAKLSSVEDGIKDYSNDGDKLNYHAFDYSCASLDAAKTSNNTREIYNWSDQDATKLENYTKSSKIDIKKGNFYIIKPQTDNSYYTILDIQNSTNLYAHQQNSSKVATFTDFKLAFLSNAYDHIFILN